MPVSSATSAQIDADGFLWFATHDGLARFDGRRFSVFDNARFPEMGSNRFLKLYRGANASVYGVGVEGDWLKIDSRNIAQVRFDPQEPNIKVTFVTRAQSTDNSANGTLCVTLSAGIYCESQSIGADVASVTYKLRRKFPSHVNVVAALPTGDNDWLLVPGQGIYYASAAGLTLVWANSEFKLSIPLVDLEAKVAPDGALVIDLSEGLLRLLPDGRTRWIEADPTGEIEIVQVLLEPNDAVLVNTLQESYRIDARGRRAQVRVKQARKMLLQNWPTPINIEENGWASQWTSRGGTLYQDGEPVLQSRGEIRDVLFAESGVVWVSTIRDGVYALSQARVQAIKSDALGESNLYGTAIASDGSVWFGSLGAGVFRVDKDDRVQRFNETDGLPGPNVWAIAVAPEKSAFRQSVFALALNSGMWRLRPGMASFEPQVLPASLERASLTSISFDEQNTLWLAGSAGAWQLLQPQLGTAGWHKRWPPETLDNAAAQRVLAVLHEPGGRTWYGTDRGLYWQKGQQFSPIKPLLSAVIRSLFRADDGALWAASEGNGLSRLDFDDLTGASLVKLGRAQGMPSNSPHAILQDRQGNLWVNSNQSIFRLTPHEVEAIRSGKVKTLTPMTLGLADGLIELEGNGGVQPAAALGTSGQIWFPSQRGVVRFDPARLSAARKPGRVIIERAVAAGKVLRINWLDASALQLPLGARDITLSYNAAELTAGQVSFRYRLEKNSAGTLQDADQQKPWTEADSLAVASFDALGPGRYQFDVQAGSSDGVWSETPASLTFEVPAYFYEKSGFVFAGIALLLLMTGFTMRWRLRVLAARAQTLENTVLRRTDELSAEKARVEQTLQDLAQTHSALSESHLGIASRNQRLAEQATRLEALDRFRARMLTNVSHELRSPLMLVNLPLQELSERSLAARDKRLVALAKQQTGRLSHLVEQLVTLVQAEARQIKLKIRRIALDDLVRHIVAGFEPINVQTQIRFALQIDADLPLIYADAAQITTVLSNFLDNASKYAPIGSEVSVSVRFLHGSDSLRVAVQDCGAGFAPELAEALFGRFYRADGPPRAGREGLGVGLALAQELIVLHGGRIGASANPMLQDGTQGGGACFWFELPLGAAHVALEDLVLDARPETSGTDAAADANSTIGLAQSVQPASLLLVEDHPELAAYLAERLAEHCPVVVVADAESAWQHLRQHSTAIVVSDVMLPGQSGIELCQQIKADATLAHTPVLLISAKAGTADRQSGLDAGAFDWLTKPFTLDALLSCVQRVWPNFDSIARASDAVTKLSAATEAERTESPHPDSALDGLLALALAQLNQATFGVPEWSERAHLSERQLRRRVTELTGMAPVAWLREQRLLKVRALVSSAHCRTLAEAGAIAGIDNAGYLYRLYRARFGGD